MRNPNVLILDIETAPLVVKLWDLKVNGGYVSHTQIVRDRYVMAWGAKKLGSKETIYADQRGKGPLKDRELLLKLKPLLEWADVVITYNGESFDSRRINARFMIHGIQPPSPYKHYDVMKLVKRVADHTSNTLDYISTNVNKKYKKLHHSDFPGMSLWDQCELENVKAWQSMKKYNVHDVLSTEEAAINLLAWAPDSFPEFYPVSDRATDCGRCGWHGHMRPVKTKLNKHSEVMQYRCQKCGGFQIGDKKGNK